MGQGTVGWVLGHSQGCTKGSSEGKLLGTASLCSASWEHQRIGAVHTLSNPAPILPSQALLKTAGKSWPLLLINQVLYIYIYITNQSYQPRDGRADAPVCMYYICAWADYTQKKQSLFCEASNCLVTKHLLLFPLQVVQGLSTAKLAYLGAISLGIFVYLSHGDVCVELIPVFL